MQLTRTWTSVAIVMLFAVRGRLSGTEIETVGGGVGRVVAWDERGGVCFWGPREDDAVLLREKRTVTVLDCFLSGVESSYAASEWCQ